MGWGMASIKHNLVGETFGEWKVIGYNGHSMWRCRCSCGKVKDIITGKLTSGQTKSCGHDKLIDLTGKRFGQWEVLEYSGGMYWKCRCDCGNIKDIQGRHLREGISTSCGHDGSNKRIDLTGMIFGEYIVLGYAGDKYWRCRCSCGKVKDILGARLRSGDTKSCGHANKLIDLVGKRFGKLKPIEYLGDRKYKCLCDCGNYTEVMSCNLNNGSTNSCGCIESTVYTKEYIEEKINELRIKLGRRPYKYELFNELDISNSYIDSLIRKYEIPQIKFNETFASNLEEEIYAFIKEHTHEEIILHNRKIIEGYELDIYMPSLKLAIEVNGDYWHNVDKVGKYYHQNKSLACINMGIRLIHIFEYEWVGRESRVNIEKILIEALNNMSVQTNRCEVEKICTNKHLDIINTANNSELCNIEIFGVRLGSEFIATYSFRILGDTAELVSYYKKDGVTIEKGIFNQIIKRLEVENSITIIVITCDMNKGNYVEYIGLSQYEEREVIEPNYTWIKRTRGEVEMHLSSEMDIDALKQFGLSKYGNTEDEIMYSIGFMKIYDSGKLRITYKLS